MHLLQLQQAISFLAVAGIRLHSPNSDATRQGMKVTDSVLALGLQPEAACALRWAYECRTVADFLRLPLTDLVAVLDMEEITAALEAMEQGGIMHRDTVRQLLAAMPEREALCFE